MKRYDFYVAIVVLLIAGSILGMRMIKNEEGTKQLLIKSQGEIVYQENLSDQKGREQRLTIEGAEGFLSIEIEAGKVRVVDSDCPNHFCIKQGWIDTPSQAIVCLPNQVVVAIELEGDDFLDAVVR